MSLRDLHILVTGGAGFIGSELVHQLCLSNSQVTAVDNLANGRVENIQDVLSDQVCFVKADIRNRKHMQELMRGVDVVFHLACLGVRHSIHNPHENHEVNADATLHLLSEARDAGVKRFVYVSSSEVYGTGHTVPMTEMHPTFPHTVYGSSKLAGDCYTRAFHSTYGYPTTVVRPFNAYGPRCHHEGDSGEVIPKFILRCMAGRPMVIFGDGEQTRDFTFVEDTARGIIAALADEAIGKTINLGAGREISMNDLAREVAAALGKPEAPIEHDEPRPGDVQRLHADSTLARKMLKFEPRVGLREGLRKLADWYRSGDKTPEELLEAEQVRAWETAG